MLINKKFASSSSIKKDVTYNPKPFSSSKFIFFRKKDYKNLFLGFHCFCFYNRSLQNNTIFNNNKYLYCSTQSDVFFMMSFYYSYSVLTPILSILLQRKKSQDKQFKRITQSMKYLWKIYQKVVMYQIYKDNLLKWEIFKSPKNR